jgi:hypothetical protein
VSHDLLRRLRQHAVDPVVITYARDALASGHTVELTVRRLRGLGLCPQSFLDRRRAKLHPSRIARSARDSEVSGQPIRERLPARAASKALRAGLLARIPHILRTLMSLPDARRKPGTLSLGATWTASSPARSPLQISQGLGSQARMEGDRRHCSFAGRR